jgi:alpha-beta hydrolase superfamily lysophospholipase
MKTERGTLKRARTEGPHLYFSRVAGDDVRCVVGIVPGYADYAERYERVQRAWAERGIGSIAIDLRGHGRAEGPRGACKRFQEYLDDVDELFALLNPFAATKSIFLLGHSFGGLVAASWALARPEEQRGLLLSSPYMRVALPVPAIKRAAGKLVSMVLPSVGLPSGLRGDQMTHDPELIKQYDEDPLVFRNANSRWFTESEEAQENVMARARDLAMPLYMVLGEADPVVAGGRELFEAAGSEDKTLDVRPGLLHEVLSEPEWPSIAATMADWMMKRAE